LWIKIFFRPFFHFMFFHNYIIHENFRCLIPTDLFSFLQDWFICNFHKSIFRKWKKKSSIVVIIIKDDEVPKYKQLQAITKGENKLQKNVRVRILKIIINITHFSFLSWCANFLEVYNC
jgi:hypothetical protein